MPKQLLVVTLIATRTFDLDRAVQEAPSVDAAIQEYIDSTRDDLFAFIDSEGVELNIATHVVKIA